MDLNSRQYFPDLPEQTYQIHCTRRLVGDKLCQFTVESSLDALRDWFGVPRSFITDARCDPGQILVSCVGWGMCLLDEVWAVYKEVPSWLFNDDIRVSHRNKAALYTFGSMSVFEGQLAMSILACPSSEVFTLLHGLPDRYKELLDHARNQVKLLTSKSPTWSRKSRTRILESTTGTQVDASFTSPEPTLLPPGEAIRCMVSFVNDAVALKEPHDKDRPQVVSPVQT